MADCSRTSLGTPAFSTAKADDWLLCGPNCTSSFTWYAVHLGGFASTLLRSMVICAAAQCPGTGKLAAEMAMQDVTFRVQDITESRGWDRWRDVVDSGVKRGVQSVTVAANDNTGIRRVRAFVDGGCLGARPRLRRSVPEALPRESSDVVGRRRGSTRGRSPPTRRARDRLGNNVASAARTIYVDNRAPDPPEQLTAIEPGWVAQNSFSVAWEKPSSAGSRSAARCTSSVPSRTRPSAGARPRRMRPGSRSTISGRLPPVPGA